VPVSLVLTASPVVVVSSCDCLVIGVIVTDVFVVPSTIGLQLISVDLLPLAPSNSVVSTVADKLFAINFPNLFAELKPARPTIPSL
jgi:hypothetical protein